VVDRVNRRVVACVTLMIQLAGVALLAHVPSATGVYLGCALFGLGVGNLTTLPGLILAVEWPREHFSGLVGLVVGINQLTFPTLVGVVRDWAGAYEAALGACAALQAISAALILLGPGRPAIADKG
jgi:dipeptide/tripeptide permease